MEQARNANEKKHGRQVAPLNVKSIRDSPPRPMSLRLGTRASALARCQAEWVAAQLRGLHVDIELVPIATTGDRRRKSIEAIGSPGVFTKEIQQALLDGRIDLAVHSLKDLPTAAVEGLCLAAVPERFSPADILASHGGRTLSELRAGAVVGTGSPRRRAQVLHFRSDVNVQDIRGNIDTRLRKLREGAFDALVLAEAGLRRLGLDAHIAQTLPWEVMLPAPGQGALAVETRADDATTRRLVERLDDAPTHAAVAAERALLAALGGGCLAPVAALGRVAGGRLMLVGRVLSRDGAEKIEDRGAAPMSEAAALGRRVADALLARGADRLLEAARNAL